MHFPYSLITHNSTGLEHCSLTHLLFKPSVHEMSANQMKSDLKGGGVSVRGWTEAQPRINKYYSELPIMQVILVGSKNKNMVIGPL